jgi:DNA topoisomerase-1
LAKTTTAKKTGKKEAGKSLVIVESPAKARTIHKILGVDYQVLASYGHVRDLPKSKLGIDEKNGFEPHYVVIKGREKTIKELKAAAQKSDRVYLAPDPDREGEAICWHLSQLLESDNKIHRVSFNQITENAVLEAIKHPEAIDQNKVDAQQARRILDRLVGYKVSPLLWEKVRRGLSAGRVQSVAMRLIVEREREIAAFVTEEYWNITARLEAQLPPPFAAKLFKFQGEKIKISRQEEAQKIVAHVTAKAFKVAGVKAEERRKNPQAPFITSRLQQEAYNRLRFTAKKTMMMAQQLYEGVDVGPAGALGLITYMRTDSVRVAPEALAEVRAYIETRWGKDYSPPQPNQYKSRAGAQEAHEAIRPTSVSRTPESLKPFLTKDQWLLYNLIWKRFVASQMNPALLEQTTAEITAGEALFRAVGTVTRFDGFMRLYNNAAKPTEEKEAAAENGQEAEEGETKSLPPLQAGETLNCTAIEPSQHFTQPSPRFTEATLVRELEEKGIGRPSTYASILGVIQNRDYVKKEEGRFWPTELGTIVTDLLVQSFPKLFDVDFTASLESRLDQIEEGKIDWQSALADFNKEFKVAVTQAQKHMTNIKRLEEPSEEICDQCGSPMVVKWGRFGKFLSCKRYPDCKNAKPLNGEKAPEAPPEPTGESCPKCGSPMVVRQSRYGKFIACSNYPQCKTTKANTLDVKCPRCGSQIAAKRSKKGKLFYGCVKYPKCDFAAWDKPIAGPCPACGGEILVEKVLKGGKEIRCPKEECPYKSRE